MEKSLEGLPRDDRARLADRRLTRYGIDASRLTRDDKNRLIRDEMEKRYRFARLCTIMSAAVFVICFAIASGAFIYASRLRDQGIDELEQLKEQVEQSTRVKAISDSGSIDVETMKLKRLIDRRSQIYDLLRQQIDRYNREAKEIIDSMGR